ncbi:MAG: hypothetical protein HOC71_12470 [Candidatus Latescibacteria bacterium]|nr:hypothetical protein [Candidatus Latescibacterota bacterium]
MTLRQIIIIIQITSTKNVTADLTGGDVSAYGGIFVLREITDRTGIIEQFAEAITYTRHLSYVRHYIATLLRRRIQNENGFRLQGSIQQGTILTSPPPSKYCANLLGYCDIIVWIFLLFFSVSPANTQAQSNNQNVLQTIKVIQDKTGQSITAEQLKSYGIDPSNPTQAAERAKQLGIPDAEIQKALQQAQHPDSTPQKLQESSSVIQTTPDDDSSPSIQETPSGDFPTPKPIETAPLGRGRLAGLVYYSYNTFRAGQKSVGPVEIGPEVKLFISTLI